MFSMFWCSSTAGLAWISSVEQISKLNQWHCYYSYCASMIYSLTIELQGFIFRIFILWFQNKTSVLAKNKNDSCYNDNIWVSSTVLFYMKIILKLKIMQLEHFIGELYLIENNRSTKHRTQLLQNLQNTTQFYGRLSGTIWVSHYQKKHSHTHTYPGHRPCFISFLHLLRSIASFPFNLRAWQSFCTTSVQVLLVLNPPLHTLYIFSPNHCLLFAAHAHIFEICFAVVLRLCLSLNSLLELYLLSQHQTSIWPFLSLPLKCHHIFFLHRPGLTFMQRTTSLTTAVQSLILPTASI